MALHETIGFSRLGPPLPRSWFDPATGRFAAFSEEMKLALRWECARAINDFTNMIARESLIEVPKGPREVNGGPYTHAGELEEGSLAASILYPDNDEGSRADPDWLWADISYNTEYAHAQHEGVMEYVRDRQVIHTSKGGFITTDKEVPPVDILWKVENYTTAGTKSHFLSDPMKKHIPEMEEYVGTRIRAMLG